MYLLDTNVLSEIQKPQINEGVKTFFATTQQREIFLSTISLAELGFGIYRLSEGKKKETLKANLQTLKHNFRGQIIAFSEGAAEHYSQFMARQIRLGYNDDVFDAMLIAAAATEGLTVVTRNIKDFEKRGVRHLNPFS